LRSNIVWALEWVPTRQPELSSSVGGLGGGICTGTWSETGDRGNKGENWDFDHDLPDEEDWEVQANEVKVPVLCIELGSMPPWVTCGVGILSLNVSIDQKKT